MNSRSLGGRWCSPILIFTSILFTSFLLIFVWSPPRDRPPKSAVECRRTTSLVSGLAPESEFDSEFAPVASNFDAHQNEITDATAAAAASSMSLKDNIENIVNNEQRSPETKEREHIGDHKSSSHHNNHQKAINERDILGNSHYPVAGQQGAPTNAEPTKKTEIEEQARDVIETTPGTTTRPQEIISDDTKTTTRPSEYEPKTTNSPEQLTTEQPTTTLEPCETLCLNDGVCVKLPNGREICECKPGFYGTRCQLRDICKTIIADSLTGDQICSRLKVDCKTDDKLFRCLCKGDEYFVFKADYYRLQPGATIDVGPNGGSRTPAAIKEATAAAAARAHAQSSFAYDSPLPLADGPSTATGKLDSNSGAQNRGEEGGSPFAAQKTHFLAECRKIDKCLGVRCRQMSERCVEGACECNQNLGYIRDPKDRLCKLLDPCKMPTPDGKPICGQAKCVATYDRDLYHCVCPIGYNIVQKGSSRSSTQCGLPFNTLCDIPLLNKCQHLCRVDQKANTYRCSCLPGYVHGSRPNVDDHLCFFDEYPNSSGASGSNTESDLPWNQRHATTKHTNGRRSLDETIPYDTQQTGQTTSPSPTAQYRFRRIERPDPNGGDRVAAPGRAKRSVVIKRELVMRVPRRSGELPVGVGADGVPRYARKSDGDEYGADGSEGSGSGAEFEDDQYGADLSALSAQDRCNMYCEENKICVLETGSTDSYKCVCERQGYVSVGDKCLDWCSAAEFSHGVQSLVDEACYTGLCKRRPEVARPPPDLGSIFYRNRKFQELPDEEKDLLRLEARSSWRPSFECDCSKNPVMFKDPASHLCQLDFEAILRPCQPGNEGHTDCVVNKHAYCAVLHRPAQSLYRDVKSDMSDATPQPVGQMAANQRQSQLSAAAAAAAVATAAAAAQAKKLKVNLLREKPYTCVCSPEKKFLVDKPRNKARCIDECDLLNSECGRFNRMCRRPSVDSNEDFGYRLNLIRMDRDGVRMNQFRRTGCECLPGFNVGPTEARDFTLDDNDARDRSYNNYPGDALALSSGGGGGVPLSRPSQMFGGAQSFSPLPAPPGGASAGVEFTIPSDPQLLVSGGQLVEGDFTVPNFDHPRTKYMNINSRCLLDYDVVEFHARFKAPSDFEPAWVKVRNRDSAGPISGDSGPTTGGNKDDAAGGGDKGDLKPQIEVELSNQLDKTWALNQTLAGRSAQETSRQEAGEQSSSSYEDSLLRVPEFMRVDMSDFYKHIVLVAQCDHSMAQLSLRAFEACIRYRYWVVHKLRTNFADWRQVMSNSLRKTFDLMDGNIRFRVNKCESTINRVRTIARQPGYEFNEQSLATSGEGHRPQEAAAELHRSTSSKEKKKTSEASELAKLGAKSDSQGAAPPPPSPPPPPPVGQLPDDEVDASHFDPLDQYARVDADVDCELTIHSASDDDSSARRHVRKVLLEKQLPRFIFGEPKLSTSAAGRRLQEVAHVVDQQSMAKPSNQQAAPTTASVSNEQYYLMAPNVLIARNSYDHLAAHRKLFSPCKSDYAYCDKQTRCEMVDSVNYTCTCEAGYTPIGSRDIYLGDSRKEVCEDIDECLFDVCKLNGLENKSICVNEIGDYKCQCIRHHVGDNKRYCNHICNVIACKHGDCRIPDEHHAFCECHEGYREPDCSVQDPSVALRKANMIICGSIFASVLLLAITLAISLNSQLKKTKKKLKRLEAAHEAVEFYEFSLQQPPYRQRVSKASTGS